MSGFDPVSYAAGRKAGEKGGGREPVLETLYATDNGLYTPDEGVDGFSEVNVDVPAPGLTSLYVTQNGEYTSMTEGVPGFDIVDVAVPASGVLSPLNNPATADDILSGKEAYDDQGNVIQGTLDVPPLLNQAGPGDIRAGKSCYDSALPLTVINGTLADAHQRVPVFWDDANSVFLLTSAVLDRAMATLAADGALVGYLRRTGSGAPSLPIPVELVPSGEVEGMVVLTGGVTTGSNDDKYVTQARIDPATGAIDAEKTYYIRAITTLTRHLADWLAEGDYLSLFLLA